MAGRLRYWDGTQWTEHLAAPQPPAPVAPVPPSLPPTAPPFARYGTPAQGHITLFNNPYEKPPRTKRRAVEDSMSGGERVRAAAIDAALVIPFFIIAFGLGPLLGWISGNHDSANHAYHVVGIVLAVVLGLGVTAWNFLVRDTTLGTDVVVGLKKKAP
jgi:hypothetical protein